MKAAGTPPPDIKEIYTRYWATDGFCPRGRLHPDLASILDQALAGQPGKLLDMGCGDAGTLGPWAKEKGWDYLGVDVSPEAVKLARQAGFAAEEIGEDFVTDLPATTFDAVCCFEVLEHLLAPEKCLLECLRLLKPDGQIIITVPNAGFWRHRLDLMFLARFNPNGDDRSLEEPWRDPHVRFFTQVAFRRFAAKTGVVGVRQTGYGGGILGSLPFMHRQVNPWKSSRIYRTLARLKPSLFAAHLVILGRKSGEILPIKRKLVF